MKKRLTFTAIVTAGLALAAIGAAESPTTPAASTVHKIELPRYQSDLPDADGREAFATACLSCHSTAYVNGQPPMTAAKWEATVKKMKDTYGAPIADDQIAPIVRYLTAVKDNANSATRIREAPVVVYTGGGELILPAKSERQRDKDAQRGDTLFNQTCAPCHGPDARGGGPAGLVLLPRPADLTAGRLSDEGIAHVVCNGIPGTAMASFRTIPPQDLQAIEAYVLTLNVDEPPPANMRISDETRKLYLHNCASCHGETGRGDGYAAHALPRRPADFKMRMPAPDYAMDVITFGVPGTGMPAWKSKLSDAQRSALADYVRTFFNAK